MRIAVSLMAVAAILVAAGCGGSEPREASPAKAAEPTPEQLAELPAPLAANLSGANQLVPGGLEEFDQRLTALQGFPVVVNRWASWFQPCLDELPFFSDSADAHRSDVAFLGINTLDEPGAAGALLEQIPLPFPSVEDPDGEVADTLGIYATSPSTVLIDSSGEPVFTLPGAYASRQQLEADIERYLLSAPGAA